MVTEYRAGLGSRLFLFVVFSGLVGLGVGLLLPDALPHSLGFNQRRMISWVVIAIAVVLIGYITFVHLAVKVRVGPQGVEVFRGPRRAYVFPPGTRYRVEIVHQRYNGVKAGTVRNLIADPSGRAKRITIPKISREKFNELYQRLEPLQVPNAMPAPAVPAMPPPSGSAASFAAPPAPSAPAAPAPASFAPRSQWAGGKRGVPERVDVLPGSVVLDGEQVRFDSLTSL